MAAVQSLGMFSSVPFRPRLHALKGLCTYIISTSSQLTLPEAA